MKEAKFISGQFLDYVIPKEKWYLYKYFKTDIEKQFLKYYFCFNEINRFAEHTGYHCQQKWLKILVARLNSIIEVHAYLKQELELDDLARMEKGKMSYKEIEKIKKQMNKYD